MNFLLLKLNLFLILISLVAKVKTQNLTFKAHSTLIGSILFRNDDKLISYAWDGSIKIKFI
jgi:hypothetical protein